MTGMIDAERMVRSSGESSPTEEKVSKTEKKLMYLFVTSFLGAITASVLMIRHEIDAQSTGHENWEVPLLLFVVQILKLPTLLYKQQGKLCWTVETFYVVGTVFAFFAWLLAFLIACKAVKL